MRNLQIETEVSRDFKMINVSLTFSMKLSDYQKCYKKISKETTKEGQLFKFIKNLKKLQK
tara:strand:+ start:16564 stop:16743 length:180 start_codon:yes stop_codon:yes gene_type:complete